MYRKIERSLVAGDEHGVFIERISLKLKNEKKMKKNLYRHSGAQSARKIL